MKFSTVKEFPFSMETAWKALQDPAKLDVEPGDRSTDHFSDKMGSNQ